MFQWSKDNLEVGIEGNRVLPLEKLELTTRNEVLRTFPVNHLLKMSLKSMEAAIDIGKAQIHPKNLTIIAGHLLESKVEFRIDGFSCNFGTGSVMMKTERKEKREFKFCPVKTITGETFDCAIEPDCLFIYVPQDEDMAEAVRIFYTHWCHVFKEALKTSMFISGKYANLHQTMCSIRSIKEFDRLELSRYWNTDEHETQLFQIMLTETTSKHLTIQDNLPVEGIPFDLNRNFNWGCMDDWLTEESLRMIDAKHINLESGKVAEPDKIRRFNLALKIWRDGSGLEKMESVTCRLIDISKVHLLTEGLQMEAWVNNRRPAYYCTYETNENNEEVFSGLLDIRNSLDTINEKGEYGTFIQLGNREWMFLVWSKQQRENAKRAPEKIREARQKLSETVKKIEDILGKLHEEIRQYGSEQRDIDAQKERLKARIAKLEKKHQSTESENAIQKLKQQLSKLTSWSSRSPGIFNLQRRIRDETFIMVENRLKVEDLDRHLKMIAQNTGFTV